MFFDMDVSKRGERIVLVSKNSYAIGEVNKEDAKGKRPRITFNIVDFDGNLSCIAVHPTKRLIALGDDIGKIHLL